MKALSLLRSFAIVATAVWLGACASLATQQGAPDPSRGVRIVNGESYRVIRAEPLVVYERDRSQLIGKHFATVTVRFFSTTVNTPLRPLTLVELKKAYPDNHQFHDLLTLAFASDADLMRWDSFHREYLVARLLRLSLPIGTTVSSR